MASPDKKSFLLRLDPALWAELQRLAATDLRSVNAQVEYMLRDAVNRRIGVSKAAAAPTVEVPRLVRRKKAG